MIIKIELKIMVAADQSEWERLREAYAQNQGFCRFASQLLHNNVRTDVKISTNKSLLIIINNNNQPWSLNTSPTHTFFSANYEITKKAIHLEAVSISSLPHDSPRTTNRFKTVFILLRFFFPWPKNVFNVNFFFIFAARNNEI